MNARVEHIFTQEMEGDTSFTERGSFWSGPITYSQSETRDVWNMGIKHGIEIGLRRASLEGQKLEIHNNTKKNTPLQEEFLKKHYELCERYGCAIQYHPELGMTVIDRNYGRGILAKSYGTLKQQ